jgi:dimeric dUTPase (all-alpha-NTP-PPase superfamily)
MNIEKLFEMQKELGQVGLFNYRGPDRSNKLILALLVELGECANEWRGFKFWSQNQQPRTKQARVPYMDIDDAEFYNPLLEEYVDCLHFILELGLELGVNVIRFVSFGKDFQCESITKQFLDINYRIMEIMDSGELETRRFYWDRLFLSYVVLGEMLGFAWEEVEQAYFAKNKINHTRQEVGY